MQMQPTEEAFFKRQIQGKCREKSNENHRPNK